MRQEKAEKAGRPDGLPAAAASAEGGAGDAEEGGPGLDGAARGLHIVLVAYGCDPTRGSEPAVGWGWAETLARRGHTVEVLTHPDRDNERQIRRRVAELGDVGKRIRPHVIPAPRLPSWTAVLPGCVRDSARNFLRYDGWQRRALAHARSHGLDGADLVHHVSFVSLQGGCALHRLGPPLVFGPVGGGQTAPHSHRRYLGSEYLQEVVRTLRVRHLGRRPLCRTTLREAAAVLVTNWDTDRRARRLGRTDTRLMLADGIHESVIREPLEARQARSPLRPPTILWVGGLTAHKAPELALRAMAHVRSEHPRARMEFLGDGPLRPSLERLARRLGVSESVDFRGEVPWTEVRTAYDAADVFLMTSLRDSFGTQSLEAWARGLPVVHLGHQGIGDFSAPGGAVSVPLGDPADLPQRLARALNAVLDDEQTRHGMREAALAWARKHTWTAKAEAAEELYRAVLSAGRPSATPAVADRPEQGVAEAAALTNPGRG
ncbi:glycosyltransferase family 4 protein [Streptomyces sp. NPDC056503]|uniref:glycosyltransferase family 4 protein n=1 Tax=Streptomyces sp. NPDC056503 TaxID=3345842 RepID=UPI0036B36401